MRCLRHAATARVIWSAATLLCADVSTAQYANVRVNSIANQPEEVVIAANPTNPLELAAGSNLRSFYRSSDGGLTWTHTLLPVGTYGDPCVIYDAKGALYYAHLADRPQGVDWLDRIVIHRSTNGGLTWKDSVAVGINIAKDQDKEWLAADMTNSPYRNNLYLAWTEFDVIDSDNPADSSRILFSRSTNGGDTWSAPMRISEQAGNCEDSDSTTEGAVPAIGPNGEVYLSWGGPAGILFDRSTDGGVTFGADRFVTSQPGGWDFAVSGIYRVNGMPETACDISNSPYRGYVYILWSDQRAGVDNTDVFLVRSTDKGNSWSTPLRVNNDLTTRHQFFPWLAIDQSTGYLYVAYYDRRATGGDNTEVYLSRSTDGGTSFNDVRVSAAPFLPDSRVFFGDYIGICATGGQVRPIWMRMDTLSLSVWTALVKDSVLSGVSPVPDLPETFSLDQNYPNPFNPTTAISYQLSSVSKTNITVYDMLGREVAVLVSEVMGPGRYTTSWDASKYSSGVYLCRMTTGKFSATRSMILLR